MRLGKKFTLGFLPTLLVLIAVLVSACSGGTTGTPVSTKPAAAPKAQQVFRTPVFESDIASFDPGLATDQYSINAIQMIFTGLVQLNDQLAVVPQLAKSYESSPDGLTWTFHLKPNLKFSDGTPLTSADVAYSIDRALSPAVSSVTGVTLTYMGLIKDAGLRSTGKVKTLIGDSLNTPDDNTITIQVSQKTAYFLEALTYPTAFVVEKKVIDQWNTNWPDHLSDNGGQGGDGPFKVKSYSHTTGIVFVPNPNYYGAQPQLQEVDFDFYKTVETGYAAYQSNQLDNTSIPPVDLPQAKLKTKEYHQYSQLTIDYVALNFLYKPLDNIKIRQALELAINKDALSTALYAGGRTPTCHIVPQGMPGYDAQLTCPGGAPTKGDAAKAKELFTEGLTEEGLTLATFPKLKFTYESGSPTLTNEITTILQNWQQVLGITVGTNVVDFNTLLTQSTATACTKSSYTQCLNQGLAMWALAWGADYPDPQDWTTLQFDKGVANNSWNYGQNGSSDAATQVATQQSLEKADADLGSDRMSLYNAAEQQLVNDVAWLPLFQRTGHYLQKSYVVGTTDNSISEVPPDDWGNVYIAVH